MRHRVQENQTNLSSSLLTSLILFIICKGKNMHLASIGVYSLFHKILAFFINAHKNLHRKSMGKFDICTYVVLDVLMGQKFHEMDSLWYQRNREELYFPVNIQKMSYCRRRYVLENKIKQVIYNIFNPINGKSVAMICTYVVSSCQFCHVQNNSKCQQISP